jgi:hypothetical protein
MAKRDEEGEYNHLVNLTDENEDLREKLTATRAELATAQDKYLNANSEVEKSTEELDQERKKLQDLNKQIKELQDKIAEEKAATENVQEQLTALYADVEQAHGARQAALEARDEARIQQMDHQLQFEELNEQWQQTQARVTELEQILEGLDAMEASNADLSHDIARLREEVADYERTIIVKDERISHLETQYQKERQRNIASADEQARAAAASPIDEGPQHVRPIGDSLAAELEDEEFFEQLEEEEEHGEHEEHKKEEVYQPNVYSDVTQTFAYSPIAPAVEPPRTLHVQTAASTAPVAPAIARSALSKIHEAARTSPCTATVPKQTLHVQEAAKTSPRASTVPKQDLHIGDAVSTAPIEPTPTPSSLSNVRMTASTSPRAATVPKQTLHVQEAAKTSPRAATVPKQDIYIGDAVSTAPIEPTTVPSSLMKARETASTLPIEPTLAPSAISDLHELASFAPIDPVSAPSAISNVRELASFAPIEPTPAPFTFHEHEIAEYSPRQPQAPLLTVNFGEAASVTPIETVTADLSTQTDAPRAAALTSQLLHHATLTTSPIAPTNQSMQTDPQQLGMSVSEDLIDIAPIKPETVEPEPTTDAGIQTMPQPGIAVGVQTTTAPTVPTTASGTQTTPASSNNRIAPVMVTHQVAPVARAVPEPVSQHPNTTETVEIAPPVLATSSKLPRFPDWLNRLVIAFLILWGLSLYSELASWKNANGAGFGYGNGNVASRSGAYGNGRHLFGIIPMGMNIGNSWWSEQIARHMSMAITRFEDWAGLNYELHY